MPPDWPAWARWLTVALAALCWGGLVAFGIDRTLLVLSDAVDPSNRLAGAAMFGLRLCIAFVLSSLVAEELILWRYRAPIAEAAQKLAIESRENTSKQLRSIHGIEQKEQGASAAESTLATLRAERARLPDAVTSLQASATRCGNERDALGQRYAVLRARAKEDLSLSDALATLGQRVADKRRECYKVLSEASTAKAAFFKDKDRSIAEASEQLRDSNATLAATRHRLDAEQSNTGAATSNAWRDGSSREAAFARVKAERKDVRSNARLLWIALLLLELLPLLGKMLAQNNPVSATIRNHLLEETAKVRMLSVQATSFERLWGQTIATDGNTRAAVEHILTMQNAGAPLYAFEHLARQIEQTADRLRRRANSSGAAEMETAFLNAQAAAFERLNKSYV